MNNDRHEDSTRLQDEIVFMTVQHGDAFFLTEIVTQIGCLRKAKVRHVGVDGVFIRSVTFDPALADDDRDSIIRLGDSQELDIVTKEIIIG